MSSRDLAQRGMCPRRDRGKLKLKERHPLMFANQTHLDSGYLGDRGESDFCYALECRAQRPWRRGTADGPLPPHPVPRAQKENIAYRRLLATILGLDVVTVAYELRAHRLELEYGGRAA